MRARGWKTRWRASVHLTSLAVKQGGVDPLICRGSQAVPCLYLVKGLALNLEIKQLAVPVYTGISDTVRNLICITVETNWKPTGLRPGLPRRGTVKAQYHMRECIMLAQEGVVLCGQAQWAGLWGTGSAWVPSRPDWNMSNCFFCMSCGCVCQSLELSQGNNEGSSHFLTTQSGWLKDTKQPGSQSLIAQVEYKP